MALFQPTNVIPSSFTVGVVDASQDNAQISWQVNGNSAMTAFEIEFLSNDDNSTPIEGAGTGKQPIAGGFFGTDRFGQPKMYTWNAGETWNSYNTVFTNGNQYKFKIKQYWMEGGVEKFIEQIESNVFITRSKPSLNIFRSTNSDFTGATSFPSGSILPSSIGYFVGNYTQAQGAPVRDVRWQVATWINGTVGEILADTGDVDTPTLQYSFNGFFIGSEYAVRCSGKADYQTYGTQDFDSGWTSFTAKIPDNQQQSYYTGNFTVQCLPKENAALLQWEGIEVIPPLFSDGYNPLSPNGSVSLPVGTSITWNQKKVGESSEDMNFASPWTIALKLMPKTGTQLQSFAISGLATTEIRSAKDFYSVKPITSVQQSSRFWQSDFRIYPQAPYIELGINLQFQLRLNGGGTIISRDYTINSDGSLSYTVVTSTKPTSANFINVIQIAYCYKQILTFSVELESKPQISDISDSVIGNDITYEGKTATVTLYGRDSNIAVSATVTGSMQIFLEEDKVFEINGANISIGVTKNGLSFYNGGDNLGNVILPTTARQFAAIITPTKIQAYAYQGGTVTTQTLSISYSQQPITSVAVYGGTNGITINAVSVFEGNGENILPFYNDSEFEPVWNSDVYTLYMTANFNGNFEGGTGSSSGSGFRIYRQEVGSDILTPIATLSSDETSLKDYGIRSRKAYKYSLYAYDINDAFMQSVENNTILSTCFKSYSLLVCDYDSVNDAYHVRKQYIFALNLSAGSVGNNNSPTLNANFTQYPTRMPSTQNYASGTLQGLIGAIYTVPALIEQIGGFKHTSKPSTLDYFDSVDLEQELYDLSTASYQLFLRDMKGHLRMVATNNQISMTPNLKQRQQSITISFPWVEIGDASDVTIIQTPDDYGWNNDNQVLDVRLDVDPTTGVLTANYPKPYNGTKFYLTGANKEILGAETPVGIMPAQFTLSETAFEPNDGTLSATAKINKEEGD